MERKVRNKAEFQTIVTEEVNKLQKVRFLKEEKEKIEKELRVLKEDIESMGSARRTEEDRFGTIYMSYLNGIGSDVIQEIEELTIGELMRFLKYWNGVDIN